MDKSYAGATSTAEINRILNLAESVSEVTARLHGASENLSDIASRIHGPRPEPVANVKDTPPRTDSLAARIADLLVAAERVERAVASLTR